MYLPTTCAPWKGEHAMTVGQDIETPWGRYRVLDQGPGFQVKKLMVKPGGALSSQSHEHRSEHWVVATGIALVTIEGRTDSLSPGETADVPVRTVHRIRNETDGPVEVIEVQYGDHISEDDVRRYEDLYGRA